VSLVQIQFSLQEEIAQLVRVAVLEKLLLCLVLEIPIIKNKF